MSYGGYQYGGGMPMPQRPQVPQLRAPGGGQGNPAAMLGSGFQGMGPMLQRSQGGGNGIFAQWQPPGGFNGQPDWARLAQMAPQGMPQGRAMFQATQHQPMPQGRDMYQATQRQPTPMGWTPATYIPPGGAQRMGQGMGQLMGMGGGPPQGRPGGYGQAMQFAPQGMGASGMSADAQARAQAAMSAGRRY